MNSVKYYAQFDEDKVLHDIFKKKIGTCVEVGGFDGVTGSNTYFFENLGWRCLIVEPMPDFCQKIKQVRKCEVAEIAASDKSGEVEFYVATGVETLSTIEKDDKHFQRISRHSNEGVRKIKVNTARLDDILIERGFTDIDFLTIDVEGHEMSVLSGMTFKIIKPRIVIIEDNSSGVDAQVKEFMESVDYRRFKRTGCNDWYAKKDDELSVASQLMLAQVHVTFVRVWHKLKSIIKYLINR